MRNTIFLLAGIIGGLVVYFLFAGSAQDVFTDLEGEEHLIDTIGKVAGVGTTMAILWITECIPLFVTAMLPLVAFPLLNVMSMEEVAPNYGKEIIFLFVGSFLIAFAFEKWNLHKRIALGIITRVGNSPTRIILGFMLASYLLSWWILNTATVAMLLPAALAVVNQFDKVSDNKMGVPLLLGIAYASSIGGMTTPIGTAPNIYMLDFVGSQENGLELSFYEWMKFGLPVSVTMFVVLFFFLKLMFRKRLNSAAIDLNYCRIQYRELGAINRQEWKLIVVFIVTVFGWFFIKDIQIGSFTIPGWGSWVAEKKYVKESTVAILAAVLLFILPSGKGDRMISGAELRKVPYDILLLFGGGFALAAGFKQSGLTSWLGAQLEIFNGINPVIMVAILCLFMTFLTELTSNTSSTILMLPVVWELGVAMGCDPLLLIIPMTLSASCAFMLPVATPPNAIVFGSGQIKIRDMSRVGIVLNLVGVVIISLLSVFLI